MKNCELQNILCVGNWIYCYVEIDIRVGTFDNIGIDLKLQILSGHIQSDWAQTRLWTEGHAHTKLLQALRLAGAWDDIVYDELFQIFELYSNNRL